MPREAPALRWARALAVAGAVLPALAAAPLALGQEPDQARAARLMDDLMWGRGSVGGPFELIDHTGTKRTDADFRGKLLLLYFGYTYCPDICPTDLAQISLAIDELGVAGQAVQPLFISVDPARAFGVARGGARRAPDLRPGEPLLPDRLRLQRLRLLPMRGAHGGRGCDHAPYPPARPRAGAAHLRHRGRAHLVRRGGGRPRARAQGDPRGEGPGWKPSRPGVALGAFMSETRQIISSSKSRFSFFLAGVPRRRRFLHRRLPTLPGSGRDRRVASSRAPDWPRACRSCSPRR